MVPALRALLLLSLSSCTVSVSLEGKLCADTEPRCLPGYHCDGALCVGGDAGGTGGSGGMSGAGGGAGVCAFEADPAASSCAGRTWYVAPGGSDTADGTSPATARRASLTGLGITRGDVIVLLGGTYVAVPPLTAAMSGVPGCPLLVRGEPDAGTVLRATLHSEASRVVFRDLVFEPGDDGAVEVDNASDVVFQRDTFRGRPHAGFPMHLHFFACTDCVVRECTFEDDGHMVLTTEAETVRLSFRGNRVHMHTGAGFNLRSPGLRLEANDFSGTYDDSFGYLTFSGAGSDGVVARNLFHAITAHFPDKYLIGGAARVTSNTFVDISDNDTSPLVRNVARFDDNLVKQTQWVVGTAAPVAGDYNLFDPSALRPYADYDGGALPGTDRVALVDFDPQGFVPRAGSAAVDRADPALPVPFGGGARADVGAFERDAGRGSDGRYCFADAGR